MFTAMLAKGSHGALFFPDFELDVAIDFEGFGLVAFGEESRGAAHQVRQTDEVVLHAGNEFLLRGAGRGHASIVGRGA